METLSLADLRCFLAIVKSGNITRAGAELGLQKAAVSKALARLEEELGVKLFERSTRRLAITRAGSVLQKRAESLLADVEVLRSEVGRDEREVGGTLTIAAPPELGVALTGHSFASYLESYPRVRLALKLDYAYHDLFDPEIDVAFRIGEVRDESLVARPLWTFQRVLVASDALLARHKLRSPADLEQTPCLAFDERGFRSSLRLVHGDESRSVEVDSRFGARSYPALVAAAQSGLGVACLPEFVVAPLVERGQLLRVLPRWRSDEMTVSLVYRPGQARVRRVGALIEHLGRRRDLPPGLHLIRGNGQPPRSPVSATQG